MLRFRKDETGSGNPIEFSLLLPLFLVLLVGLYQVWEVISVKESLDRAVLQAAEYWSTCLPLSGSASTHCQPAARAIIERELAHNSIVRARAAAGQLEAADLLISYRQQPMGVLVGSVPVIATPRPGSNPDDWPTFHPFIIEARLAIPWAVDVPFFSPLRLVIRAEHVAFKEAPYERATPETSPASIKSDWDTLIPPTRDQWESR